MFRPVARVAARAAGNTSTSTLRRIPTRRWASTGADKPRSWKSGFARWGLAGAAVYYYNTSPLFAEEASQEYAHHPPPAPSEVEEPRTLESYAKKAPAAPVPALSNEQTPVVASEGATATGGAGDLESEAAQQGAFNEETGEINWDCPCLGGMAHGPCGEEFKAAFSCFVYSKEEPKGVDCIEKFKGMQDCFRAHPDIYGAELEDEEEEGFEGRLPEGEAATALARDGEPSLETVKEGAKEAAKEVDEEVKIKVASVQDDIRQDAQALKTKVEDKLQEKRTDLKEGQETVRKVAQEVSGAKELKSDS